jgi:hypothetical protein
MKLDEFIANVLQDIDNGLQRSGTKTDRKYYVEVSKNSGVSFDIAVTTVNTSDTQAEGKAKAGFIEVLGAGVGAKLEDKKEDSQVSRIQFVVHVPYTTEKKAAENSRRTSLYTPGRRYPDEF